MTGLSGETMKSKSQNPNKTEHGKEPLEIFFCLDVSGSMQEIRAETIEAFNAFVKRHNEDDTEHNQSITVDLFNTSTTTLYNGTPVSQFEGLSTRNYCPDGQTAMLDSMGKIISDADKKSAQFQDDFPNVNDGKLNILVTILSDGRENASREYSFDQIKKMIQAHLTDLKWDIAFLTSDTHAKQMAIHQLGIPESKIEIFECNARGIQESFEKISRAASEKKRGQKISNGWKETRDETPGLCQPEKNIF
ncbi:MAG: VWA domain-containing protein [Methanoregula sp.]